MFAQEYFYQDKPNVVVAIMNQFSFNAGLKEWLHKSHSAANREMKQINLRNNCIPMHRQDLTYEERQMLLELHVFLKKKWDGNIKEQTVAGVNKQCMYIPK